MAKEINISLPAFKINIIIFGTLLKKHFLILFYIFIFTGGDGFLAPVGNKGQFKDFCDQHCLNKLVKFPNQI